MAKRLVRWFTYTIFFALLPLGISILIRSFTGNISLRSIANSPEFLFFSLMVTATALGDLSETFRNSLRTLTFDILRSGLLLGAVFSAILYGSFIYDSITNPEIDQFRIQLFGLTKWLAIVFGIVSTIAEAWIGRMETSS